MPNTTHRTYKSHNASTVTNLATSQPIASGNGSAANAAKKITPQMTAKAEIQSAYNAKVNMKLGATNAPYAKKNIGD